MPAKKSKIDIRNTVDKHLRTMLNEWIEVNESYCKKFPKDNLYWYNERASLSTFAGAVWKCGELCHEEFRMPKRHRKNSWKGRCDLWFTVGKKEYYVESKQIYVSLSERAHSSEKYINKALREARKDAARIERNGTGQTIGMVFVVPYIASSEAKNIKKNLELFFDELDSVDYDILAYTFPKSCLTLKSEGYIYPGVVLIGRKTKRK